MTDSIWVALIGSIIGPAVMVVLQQRTRREVRSVSDRTDHAVAELSPNHGSSAKDQLTRIEETQKAQGQAIARVEAAQTSTAKDIGGLRSELRTERAERLDLNQRLNDHITESRA